jgi:hypothetical protein
MQLHAIEKNNLAFTCITRTMEETENLGSGGRTRIQVMRSLQFVKTNGASFPYFPIFGS